MRSKLLLPSSKSGRLIDSFENVRRNIWCTRHPVWTLMRRMSVLYSYPVSEIVETVPTLPLYRQNQPISSLIISNNTTDSLVKY